MIFPSEKEILSMAVRIDDLPSTEKVCVYFLVSSDKVIYIGQTICLSDRIYSHKSSKQFDKVYFIECCEETANDIEAKYIYEIKNDLNKRMPDSSMFMSAGTMDLAARNIAWPVAREVLRNITEPYAFTINGNSHKYIKRSDQEKIMNTYAAIVRNLIQDKVEAIK